MKEDVIAINVLLEPDAAMVRRAVAANALLLQDYPRGFSLDDGTHAPHITLLQRYVHASDLQAIAAAVSEVVAAENVTELQLKATRYDGESGEAHEIGAVVILVDLHSDLRRLQAKIVEAVQPFAVEGGKADAFVANDDGSPISPDMVEYVETFVPGSSGANYEPHLTVGHAHAGFLRQLQSQPFVELPFKAADVAIYQLGDHGTARRKIWSSVS